MSWMDHPLRGGQHAGRVPRTSTLALTNATFPYAKRLAREGWKSACKKDPSLALGLNVLREGGLSGSGGAFNLPLSDLKAVL